MDTHDTSISMDEDLRSDVGSSTNDSSYFDGPKSVSTDFSPGRQEGKALRAVRLIFIFGLFCAVPLALGVYFYTSISEKKQFEQQYEQYASKVLEAIGSTLENSFGALDNLALGVVASARAANQTWPNVRVADFSLRAAKTLSLSRAKVLVTCPLVVDETYDSWTNWTAKEGTIWVDETLAVQATDPNFYGPIVEEYGTVNIITTGGGGLAPRNEGNQFLPSWQAYPIVPYWAPYNFDYISALDYTTAHTDSLRSGKIVITNPYLNPDLNNPEEVESAESNAAWLYPRIHPDEEPLEPASDLYFPIRDNVNSVATDPNEYSPVGVFAVTFYWRDMIRDILPSSARGILVVVENPCSATFTYRIDGPDTTLLGRGDRHDEKYHDMEFESLIIELGAYRIRESTYTGPGLDDEHCPIKFKIYPTEDTEATTETNAPIIYSVATLLICFGSALLFLIYDRYQERRQRAIVESAQKNHAVLSSLFPAFVRDRIIRAKDDVNDGYTPIAELYTDTTVFFADIAGFTAWSSTREATDVFTLLESIYMRFDKISRRHGVFKVETVGDSYVAVCGLPEPRKNHAVIMARFSAECRKSLNALTKELAVKLGPGTEGLMMRYGLNSGPTTAGVLRGDKTRFQLFGDTANTAARMESTGIPNRIQASRKTADLLTDAGYGSWVTKRDDLVDAKGKGRMQTYWIEPAEGGLALSEPLAVSMRESPAGFNVGKSRLEQLIDFNVEVLENLLKDLVAFNRSLGSSRKKSSSPSFSPAKDLKMPRDEIVEVIPVPELTRRNLSKVTRGNVDLPPEVASQLRDFVMSVAYVHNNQNSFHNFEHATHVAMSVRKLLSRILKPLHQSGGAISRKSSILQSTYSLTSDPMIQFAVYISALIHDAEHPGVSNGTLCEEEDSLAVTFGNKSCAEQNSVVVAWGLFMCDSLSELRSYMFLDEAQLRQFRQLVVNAVMATDVFDKDLKQFREKRWEKAFPKDDVSTISSFSASSSNLDLEGDLRATIVVEHIIQASDVVHTMQHWTVYQKWNRRLFAEMRSAYKEGRTPKDPAEGWYGGELWFFDNYIIPLAKKLKECGVFGVSCDEALDYAKDNRLEWEQKGKEIVRTWMEEEEIETETKMEDSVEKATEGSSFSSIDENL
mmetsp:Transcript_6633/g.10131  ORF Transcript_6633/g.10131 Transcript_6633/m.10131 type:complete len:1139 (+) Transcript_6633:135-3551(+)|eukprot:CAMPEP_0117008246 /NCGR_PEP_ID=MMETSP0472-20121206/7826_1 /TAXON_ID=693140 ORGANISM="Tiarina fusus, Strain LIS" /NCGR_SAMPLE_ID=MMETSP0472 /ASSEMBLY_ACC=CAM_ASM_000603 /LENGTH=1138 /DNA_ID=CAMNT_0004710223 /DNA_START=134 /DNA_END=3550 /DNA_ORIENTATION=-